MVTEFLDRVDELSAKVSTTASRYSAELADKNALLEAEGRRVEAYAGQAAIAQSVLDDMRQSTSWRMTAPVRLLSRLLARRAQPPAAARELAGRARWSPSPIPSPATSRSSSSTTTRRRPPSNA